jgi:ABC-type long-subunit fatty acid transport system fused permease/ATPase subunit
MNIVNRIQSSTPRFFKIVRNVGLALAAVSTVIATAPLALPTIVASIAGYLAVAGGVMSAVSQLTVTK